MNVLKKIGIVTFLLLSTCSASNIFAQDKCETEVKKTSVKKDPIDFVQNYLLNPKAQQANLENTTIKSNQKDLLASRTIKKEPSKTENYTTNMLNWIQEKYSSMIDVLPDQISNVMLYRFIDEWYGVRYRMGGTSKKGVDCSAFVQNLYQYVFGVNILRTAGLQYNSSQYIKNPADLKEGDLVFFRINTSRISHVGVYLRNNFFVHSACSKGVSIASLSSSYWSKYFAGGGRIMN